MTDGFEESVECGYLNEGLGGTVGGSRKLFSGRRVLMKLYMCSCLSRKDVSCFSSL